MPEIMIQKDQLLGMLLALDLEYILGVVRDNQTIIL